MELTSLLTTGALALVVNALTSLFKNFVYPRFGKFGVQVASFVIALLLAWLVLYGSHIASLWNILVAGGILFSTAVTFYEVILQRIDLFKVKTPAVENAREAARD